MRDEHRDPRFVTTFGDVRNRCLSDPQFNSLVQCITALGLQHKYTPSELRDAAFAAAVNIETMTVRHQFVVPEDWQDQLEQTDKPDVDRAAVMNRAYELDPEAWVSYSGQPKSFKQRVERRRQSAIDRAEQELRDARRTVS